MFCNFAGVVVPYDDKQYPMVYGGVKLDDAVLHNGSDYVGGEGFLIPAGFRN